MNCREFEQLVSTLPNSHLQDATRQQQGLAHAATCPRCAARLHDERVLARGLMALRADTHVEQAPPQVKAALLAAFAAQVAPTAASVAAAKTRPFRRARIWPQWTLAAAAALLVCTGVLAWWLRPALNQMDKPLQANTNYAPPRTTASPKHPKSTPPAKPSTQIAFEASKTGRKHRPTPRQNVEHTSNALAATTDFIPLTYATNAQTLQNGILLRVEVPRASLLALGLPLNAERAAEKVKAEVMLGEDGIAYAIRLLQPVSQ